MHKNCVILCLVAAAFCGLVSMLSPDQYRTDVAAYYDTKLDSLHNLLEQLDKEATHHTDINQLKTSFLNARSVYKQVCFFVERFDRYHAKAINGPDLIRIEEDNPTDSILPHGFQHIETLLYTQPLNNKILRQELHTLNEQVAALRTSPDHQYYFRNDKVWDALRLGVYETLSLGITGFEVPLSLHALPEVHEELSSIKQVIQLYKIPIEGKSVVLYKKLLRQIDDAILYLYKNNRFNSFDRYVFIQEYVNPLSESMRDAAVQLGYIDHSQLMPLNPDAANLFATDIMNNDFFSPQESFRMTPERIALGRQLFNDTRLSVNNSRSCASCHKPEMAFIDGLPKAKHINGNTELLRNTPALWNAGYQTKQFYDSRSGSLEIQLSAVVHNTEEMGGSLKDVIPVLSNNEMYAGAFKAAYPKEQTAITQYTIANAISSYIRSLISFNSRFDKAMRGQGASLSASEKNGFNLFMGKAKCGTCHYAPLFNGLVPPWYDDTESEILGVPETNKLKSGLDKDAGKYLFTGAAVHRYAFKTPTIRNTALTAPYMHNGVFKTLHEVLSFYNKGGGAGLGIKLASQTLPTDKLNLTENELKDIEAFIGSLTDTATRH